MRTVHIMSYAEIHWIVTLIITIIFSFIILDLEKEVLVELRLLIHEMTSIQMENTVISLQIKP